MNEHKGTDIPEPATSEGIEATVGQWAYLTPITVFRLGEAHARKALIPVIERQAREIKGLKAELEEYRKWDRQLSASYVKIRKMVGTLDLSACADHMAATEDAVERLTADNQGLNIACNLWEARAVKAEAEVERLRVELNHAKSDAAEPKPAPEPPLEDQLRNAGWEQNSDVNHIWTLGNKELFLYSDQAPKVSFHCIAMVEPVEEPATLATIEAALDRLRERIVERIGGK